MSDNYKKILKQQLWNIADTLRGINYLRIKEN